MKQVLFAIAFVAVAVFAMSPAAQAISLDFLPASQTVQVGTPVTVDIHISALGASALGAFDIIVVNYNPAIVSLTNATFGTGLNLGILGSVQIGPITGPGSVNMAEVSLETSATLLANQPKNFTLFSLTFSTIGLGTTPLTFSNVILGDHNGDPLQAALGTGSISAVPEPSTWLLMVTGLFALVACRKKLAVARS
jgi:hypothetical protein